MRLGIASVYIAAATGSKILMGLIAVKVIAWTLGADGLGRLGQFMSVMAMTSALAGGGILSGVVRYVAENRNEPHELARWIHGASAVSLIFSAVLSVLLLAFSQVISNVLFDDTGYYWIICVLAVAQFFMAYGNLCQGVINGHKRSDLFAYASSSGAVLGVAGLVIGSYFGGLPGAMLGLIWGATVQLLTLYPALKYGLNLSIRHLTPKIVPGMSSKYLSYSLMIIVSVCTIPMAQIVVRNLIQADSNWSNVGQWQGMVRLSDAYLQFINLMLASIYLPRLAEQKNDFDLTREVKRAYFLAAPFLIAVCLTLYVLRDLVISILFTDGFRPMRDLFGWQLAGDFFKVMSYIVGYVCVARGATKLYICAEVLQAGLYILLAFNLIAGFGTVGAVSAYALTYFVYFLVVASIFIYVFKEYIKPRNIA